ncbi:MAG: hypothetical protein N3A38_13725 [Planctomycetota bacterium]|nr:hypothetical protein [Planctomycetota bacterium]
MASHEAENRRFASAWRLPLLVLLAAIPAWWVTARVCGAAPGVRDGVAAGAAAAAVLALGGLAAGAWARNLGPRRFLAVLVGGMLARLALLLLVAAAVLSQNRLDPAAALLTMGAVYCGLLTLEALALRSGPDGPRGSDGSSNFDGPRTPDGLRGGGGCS